MTAVTVTNLSQARLPTPTPALFDEMARNAHDLMRLTSTRHIREFDEMNEDAKDLWRNTIARTMYGTIAQHGGAKCCYPG